VWKNVQLDEREHDIMYGLVRFDLRFDDATMYEQYVRFHSCSEDEDREKQQVTNMW
jgi:hypothetical protein